MGVVTQCCTLWGALFTLHSSPTMVALVSVTHFLSGGKNIRTSNSLSYSVTGLICMSISMSKFLSEKSFILVSHKKIILLLVPNGLATSVNLISTVALYVFQKLEY